MGNFFEIKSKQKLHGRTKVRAWSFCEKRTSLVLFAVDAALQVQNGAHGGCKAHKEK